MTGIEKRPPCPRCLLDEVPGGEALAALNRRWIEALPEARRADAATARARLDICRACERLAGGMCGLCGCYVEYRAAQRAQRCPDAPRKW